MALSKDVGYQVDLVSDVPERYKCPLCKLLLRNAIQTFRGELACESCYKRARRVNPDVCPIDGEPIDDSQIFQDKHSRRAILQLPCYCKNKNNGCQWEGIVQDVEEHLVSCKFYFINCESCNQEILANQLDDHMANQCLMRKVQCKFCENDFLARDLKDHTKECAQKPKECPFNCQTSVPSSEMYDHIKKCPKLETASVCPYSILGCKHKVNGKKSLEKHLQENAIMHAGLAVSIVQSVKEENDTLNRQLQNELQLRSELEKQVEKQNHEHGPLKAEMLQLKEKLSTMEKEFTDYRNRVDEKTTKLKSGIAQEKQHSYDGLSKPVQDTMAALDLKYADFERKLRNIDSGRGGEISNFGGEAVAIRRDLEQYAAKIDMIETNNAVLSANLSDLELKLQLMENTNYNGRQLWKIDNVRHRMHQAVTGKITALHSAPCFTNRAGYKFCCRLYLNGDGMGRGTHLSLFFVVMRSEYDALLSWPFTYRVTFKLINHENRDESVKETFLPDRNSSSFKRPTRDMNVAAGCPMFVQKDLLFSGNFIIDDSLFIETTVAVTR